MDSSLLSISSLLDDLIKSAMLLALMLLAQQPAAKKMVLAAADWRKISNILLEGSGLLVSTSTARGLQSSTTPYAGTDLTLISLSAVDRPTWRLVTNTVCENRQSRTPMRTCSDTVPVWGGEGHTWSPRLPPFRSQRFHFVIFSISCRQKTLCRSQHSLGKPSQTIK